jgi:predicted Zn-dependent peptidase
MRRFLRGRRALAAGWAAASLAFSQNLADIEKRVTEFDLANGMHFIVYERHGAPVASFVSHVNAGAVDDPNGAKGIAHMFEHMAFKGTETIGTKNYAQEKLALDNIEKAYDAVNAAKAKGADKASVEKLEKALKDAIEKANSFVDSEVFTKALQEQGAVGLNAGTSMDSTVYFMSMPSNRMELWMMLEAARFKTSVYREFYKERDVVREEYRMRIESSPIGKLINVLLATAFVAHPYRIGPAGLPDDIETYRVADARDFRKKYYTPANITVVCAGDVNPQEVRRMAERYFGAIPAGPKPPLVKISEPPQEGEKRAVVETPSQPFVAVGFKRPAQDHPDDPVFDVINGLLSTGRTSMFYRDLVQEKKIALQTESAPAFPGSKYQNLFILFSVPNQGKTIEENEKGMLDILEKLKKEKADPAALDRIKTIVRAGLVRSLDSNLGMAQNLASAHVNFGSWKKLFQSIDDINKVTADDVQRVAKQYFVTKNKTTVYTVQPKEEKSE